MTDIAHGNYYINTSFCTTKIPCIHEQLMSLGAGGAQRAPAGGGGEGMAAVSRELPQAAAVVLAARVHPLCIANACILPFLSCPCDKVLSRIHKFAGI